MRANVLLAFVFAAISAVPSLTLPVDVYVLPFSRIQSPPTDNRATHSAGLSVRDASLYAREPMPVVADADTPVKGPGNGGHDHTKRENADHEHDDPTHVAARGPVKTPTKGPGGKREDDHKHAPTHIGARDPGPVKTPTKGTGGGPNPKREDDHKHDPTHVEARGPVKAPTKGPGGEPKREDVDDELLKHKSLPPVEARGPVKTPTKGPVGKRDDDHKHGPTHVAARGPVKTPTKGPGGGEGNPEEAL
ncbi:uncharacterized protein C8Q71DRAFT_848094 [Rhodofomes roseus]|uniref:Uncharacterized protein n=1 Tax=Rhodofomes roseus TaxID=34475 RepID=A0ABQ8KHQ3_9APHY|nr:uncharacterized protein C8Q71DRAFT_848094 [Rhodofomes roseus]KAH9837393.1 hypothetical protein C8Q71DRAFT_848094 [Rhodofomes roseus]